MEDYRKTEPVNNRPGTDHEFRYEESVVNEEDYRIYDKPVKYRRPWKDSFKEAAANFVAGLAFLAIIVLFVSALVGAITLVLSVSWLFIFPIAAIIFIIMVLVKRFDP